MANIFNYDDYRAFIRDLYEENKARDTKFSYQYYSQKAGFKSKSYLHDVASGKKKLSRNTSARVAHALGLTGTAASFFQCLVSMNQANDNEKQAFFERLNNIRTRKAGSVEARQLRIDQFEYYSTWYHPVVRALLDIRRFKDDYKWLAKSVCPPITVPLARKSVQLLERLGMVKRDKTGFCHVTDLVLTTGRDVKSIAVKRYHSDIMNLAKQAMSDFPQEQRNISALTLGISEKSYQEICDIIYKCQDSILDIARNDEKAERVFQAGFHLFPVSKKQ